MTQTFKPRKGEKPLLITTSHRGVFFGYAIPSPEKTQTFRHVRNCLSWPSSVGGFEGLAATGPNAQTRVGPAVAEMILHDITSISLCTPEAEDAWMKCNWKF